MIVGGRLTKQTVTALVSGVLLLALTIFGLFVPVPFVIWSPGSSLNVMGEIDGKNVIDVGGAKTYRHSGELRTVAVSMTKEPERVGFIRAFWAQLSQEEDVLPRDSVYPRGRPAAEPITEESTNIDLATMRAAAAGLRVAAIPVADVPMVTQVLANGPADGILMPGDIVLSVAGKSVKTDADVRLIVKEGKIGDKLDFRVLRRGEKVSAWVTTGAPVRGVTPIVGATFQVGYQFEPVVTSRLPAELSGAGSGLVIALAVYDRLTPKSLLSTTKVAGVGAVSETGKVLPVAGVQERLTAGRRVGAEVFLLPSKNCPDVTAAPEGLRLVAVDSVSEAVAALKQLQNPESAKSVKGCPSG